MDNEFIVVPSIVFETCVSHKSFATCNKNNFKFQVTWLMIQSKPYNHEREEEKNTKKNTPDKDTYQGHTFVYAKMNVSHPGSVQREHGTFYEATR